MSLSRLNHLRLVLQRCVSHPSERSSVQCPNLPDVLIQVTPKVSLFDQIVNIRVQGLPAEAKVTLHMKTQQEWRRTEAVFRSCGQFLTSDSGDLDLSIQAALGGTYTGVEPMGLFWSMRPCPSGPQNIRMVVRNGDYPVLYTLSVYLGHWALLDLVAQETTLIPVCSTTVTRLKKAVDVRRIGVKEGQVRGVLFLPPGEGPHPGVIDMFGAAGGLMEIRAALLASHGFATLSLAFFKYEDLPDTMFALRLDYFQEAASWLSSHRAVKKDGIGVVGVSTGAMLALMMAWQIPEVKAVVSINGPIIVRGTKPIVYKKNGPVLLQGVRLDLDKIEWAPNGVITRNGFKNYTKDYIVPVWESSAHILMLVSDDDQQLDLAEADNLRSMYPEDRRNLIEVIHYPGAGHLLEPPYSPHCLSCNNPVLDADMLWGGNPADHAVAQEHSWKQILTFLHTHLS